MRKTQQESHEVQRCRRVGSRFTAALVALTLVGAACASSEAEQDAAPIGTAAGSLFAFDGLTDWISYATAVAEVEVTSEDILPPEEPDEFERLIGRTVTVEFDDVLWGEGPTGGTTTLIAPGFFENTREGTRRPFVPSDGARFEVGERYVVAFTVMNDEWTEMTSGSVIPLVGNVLTPVPGAPPAAAELTGLTLEDLRGRLQATEPDPIAAKYLHLEAHERYERVWEEKYGPPPDYEPGPNEIP